MPDVIKASQADEDVFAIWDHIAADNLSAADRFVDELDEKFHLLAEQPQIGQAREELAPYLLSAFCFCLSLRTLNSELRTDFLILPLPFPPHSEL